MLIVKTDNKLDPKLTAAVNIKQWFHTNGPRIVSAVDSFFERPGH